MTFKIQFSVQAQSEVRAGSRWLEANRSVTAADRWLASLASKIIELEADPSRFPRADEFIDSGLEVRELQFGKSPNTYRLFFEIRKQTVQILRIRHVARDTLTPEYL